MSKFDTHERKAFPPTKTESNKFASKDASPDDVSQGIKRKVEARFGIKKPGKPNPFAK